MSTRSESRPGDAAAIRHLLHRLTAAWGAGDAGAYAEVFTEDANYITFFGATMTGRAAIDAGHRALFEGPLEGSRLTALDATATIRFLCPEVALVVATGGSLLAGQDRPAP